MYYNTKIQTFPPKHTLNTFELGELELTGMMLRVTRYSFPGLFSTASLSVLPLHAPPVLLQIYASLPSSLDSLEAEGTGRQWKMSKFE